MSTAVRARLEQLREAIDADSLSEVIRRALATYYLLYSEMRKGGKPFLHYPSGEKAPVLLEFVAEQQEERDPPTRAVR